MTHRSPLMQKKLVDKRRQEPSRPIGKKDIQEAVKRAKRK